MIPLVLEILFLKVVYNYTHTTHSTISACEVGREVPCTCWGLWHSAPYHKHSQLISIFCVLSGVDCVLQNTLPTLLWPFLLPLISCSRKEFWSTVGMDKGCSGGRTGLAMVRQKKDIIQSFKLPSLQSAGFTFMEQRRKQRVKVRGRTGCVGVLCGCHRHHKQQWELIGEGTQGIWDGQRRSQNSASKDRKSILPTFYVME